MKQTLSISPDQLNKLVDKLIEQSIDKNIPVKEAKKKIFQVNIVKNKDTWELE